MRQVTSWSCEDFNFLCALAPCTEDWLPTHEKESAGTQGDFCCAGLQGAARNPEPKRSNNTRHRLSECRENRTPSLLGGGLLQVTGMTEGLESRALLRIGSWLLPT